MGYTMLLVMQRNGRGRIAVHRIRLNRMVNKRTCILQEIGTSILLIRRMLQGKELYQRDTLVDLVNLASIAYGYSIGGFDADRFVGDTLTLGIGREGEPYEGIGRGMINIHGLPVYRDAKGGVGTPTSDHERTKMTIDTQHLVVLINGYDGDEQRVCKNAEYIQELLCKYCQSDGGSYFIYR